MVSFQYRKGDEIMYLLHDVKTKETWVAPSFKDDYLFEKTIFPWTCVTAMKKASFRPERRFYSLFY